MRGEVYRSAAAGSIVTKLPVDTEGPKLAGQRPTAARTNLLYFCLFGHLKCIVNFDPEISDGTLQLCMTE